MKWTAEMDAVLVAGCSSDRPFREMALELGCTRNACLGRAHRLGLKHPSPPKKKFETAEAYALRREGMTYQQIADELGVAIRGVWLRLNRSRA